MINHRFSKKFYVSGRQVGKTYTYNEMLVLERNTIKENGSVASIMEQWQCSMNNCVNFVDEPITICDSCAIQLQIDLFGVIKSK